MMTIFLIIYAVKKNNERSLHLIGYMWLISLLFFWLPFSYYNYTTYGRYMVSPAGQSLLEGLGELPNRWGHRLNDEYVNEFIMAQLLSMKQQCMSSSNAFMKILPITLKHYYGVCRMSVCPDCSGYSMNSRPMLDVMEWLRN
jgi:hypothetical protein